MTQYSGKIIELAGDTLVIQTRNGLDVVKCCRAKTIRSLHECFGDVICRDKINQSTFRGKDIVYHKTDDGVLFGFGIINEGVKL